MTRGLHQDGLADTLDGLAGGRVPTDRLAIMRDPRIGAIGATGLFVSLILRYSALVSLPEPLFSAALCAGNRPLGHGCRRLRGFICASRRRLGRAIFSTPLSVACSAPRCLSRP